MQYNPSFKFFFEINILEKKSFLKIFLDCVVGWTPNYENLFFQEGTIVDL